MVDEFVVPTAHDAVWSHDQAVFLDAAQNCGGTVQPLLNALEQILSREGFKLKSGATVDAAERAYGANQ